MEPLCENRVALFTGCTVNYIDPDIGLDTLAVLRHNGIEVLLPQQKCCGVPLRAYGRNRNFEANAKYNLKSFTETGCDTVTPCTSCAHALKEDYASVLSTFPPANGALRTYDILEYLIGLHQRKKLRTAFQKLELRVLYHAPCHLKCLGRELIETRLALLRKIPGLAVDWIDRGCCGMGGTFGMKKKNYDLSVAIGHALAQEIKKAKPDGVISECPGCRMQISHLAGYRVQHPIRLIKMAYGL